MKKNTKKTDSSFSTKEVVFLVVITCLLSFTMAYIIFNKKSMKPEYKVDPNISQFLEQYEYIVDNYYDEVDKEELISGAIMGMLYSLDDPYAEYYDEVSANSFNARLNGYYEGIGIEIVKPDNVYIVDVFKNSSAYEKGLKVGDVIVEINGIAVSGITNEEFLSMIKNTNDIVNLKILRGSEEFNVETKKSKITLDSVEYKIVNDNYGYIKINIFALNTYDQFKKALEELNKKNIKGLIIDLRGNPGGHLTTTEKLLSLLIKKDKVIYQIYNQGKKESYYSSGEKDYKTPIAIIVDNESASASELMTAALKEQLGAKVIGKTTFGKGTVQELVNLSSGKQYKITTKRWLTSLGNEIEEVGVEPSRVVSDEEWNNCIDIAIEELQNN